MTSDEAKTLPFERVCRNLSSRAWKAIMRSRRSDYFRSVPCPIMTLGDLAKWTAEDLEELRNVGPTTVRELRELLAQYGLALRSELPTHVQPDLSYSYVPMFEELG